VSDPGPYGGVAVLIPCYNEEITVRKVVEDFRRALPGSAIYVFDNNSKDRTAAIAREAGALVVPSPRQGKGHVVRHMFQSVEAEAYRCDLELNQWRWGTLPDARELAEKLGSYGCRPADVDLAERMLRIWSVPIRHGAVLGEASQVAIAWLNEHVPHLRSSGA